MILSFYNFHAIIAIFVTTFLLIGCEKSVPDYTINAKVNPYGNAPLSAVLEITTTKPCKPRYKVLGKTPIEQSYGEVSGSFTVPVVGLYPGTNNHILVILEFNDKVVSDTLQLKTQPLPNFFPEIVINKINRESMEPGFHGCDMHYANHGKFSSVPMIFDDEGQVRWFLDLSSKERMVSPFQRLKNGNILMVDRFNIFEYDMLGKPLKKTTLNDNYGMHHDVAELPNGDLLICVGKRNEFINLAGKQEMSDSDFIVHFDKKNSRIVKEWDLAKHLDVTRDDLNFFRKGDWLHMNGLAFNEKDSTIIVSGKNQGLAKLSWNDQLQWILSPKKNWGKSGRNQEGVETQPFLLTAVNALENAYPVNVQSGITSHEDFDFPWSPHAPLLLPNGNLMVFDNGTHRNFKDKVLYSRAVEYNIDESTKIVRQVWQFGKERGEDFFSSIISDVDYLTQTGNILVTSGFLNPKTKYSAKIVEVDYTTKEPIFEATLFYKTLNGDQSGGWGQSDILYRSERMELKY